MRELDLFDIGLSALGGNSWGVIATGAIGGLVDFDLKNKFVGPSSKGNFQLGADVLTGVVFGGIGMGIANYVSPAWKVGSEFLTQLGSDVFDEGLTMK